MGRTCRRQPQCELGIPPGTCHSAVDTAGVRRDTQLFRLLERCQSTEAQDQWGADGNDVLFNGVDVASVGHEGGERGQLVELISELSFLGVRHGALSAEKY